LEFSLPFIALEMFINHPKSSPSHLQENPTQVVLFLFNSLIQKNLLVVGLRLSSKPFSPGFGSI
jgi:hypothetical protein